MSDLGNQFIFTDMIHTGNDDLVTAFIPGTKVIKGSYSYFGKTAGLNNSDASAPTKNHGGAEEKSRWMVKSPTPQYPANTTRAKAIAGYRQEMLDLVRDMPESAYELSLKDIVELPRSEDCEAPAKGMPKAKAKAKAKAAKRVAFLLKLFFPIPSAVSPRPLTDGCREWWKEEEEEEELGERSGSSGSSSSGNSRSGIAGGCFSFNHSRKTKAGRCE